MKTVLVFVTFESQQSAVKKYRHGRSIEVLRFHFSYKYLLFRSYGVRGNKSLEGSHFTPFSFFLSYLQV